MIERADEVGRLHEVAGCRRQRRGHGAKRRAFACDRGYTITRLQQVNENLERSHYRSDLYRVVFFGKHAEVRRLAADYPMLIPFLPLQVTIFAEGDQAIVVAADPLVLAHLYPDPALRPVFETWARDLRAILDAVRE